MKWLYDRVRAMISGLRKVPKEWEHTVSVLSRVSVGSKENREPLSGIEGKEGLVVELSMGGDSSWGRVRGCDAGHPNVLYGERIPNSPRGAYMTRVCWMMRMLGPPAGTSVRGRPSVFG